MEGSEQINTQNRENRKNTQVKMIAGAIILGVLLIFLVVMYFDQKHKMNEMEQVLTHEKDSLANELKLMIHGYDTLKSDNDTLNAHLAKERNRIVKLLSINASNAQLIRTYKKEISTMREIMKSYIVQIDSLNTRNKLLVTENTDMKQQISEARQTASELSKVKEVLSTKVEIASVIQAKDIVAVAINKNRKETTRISLVDKIRVCFTLRENPIASAGEKEVFMRIQRPDSLVITDSPNNLFDFKGDKLIYSASRKVDYLNQDVEMCIFLDNTGDFIPGVYNVGLYLEGSLIGRSNLVLKTR
jgi:Tfp pilus assembly protein PilN